MKIRKNLHIGFITAALAVLSFGFASCGNLSDSAGDTSLIRISLSESEARTAFPSLTAANFSNFKFYGKNLSQNSVADWRQLGESNYASYADLQAVSFEVTKQNWAFKLTAESSGLFYSDEKTGINITDDETNLSFVLKQSSGQTLFGAAEGTAKVVVNFPNNASVEKVTVTVQKSDGTSHIAESEVTASNGSVTYESSLATGQYKLIFQFYGDSNKSVRLGYYMLRVIIAGGAESSSTIEIPSFDAIKSVCYVYDETTSVTYYSRQSPLTIKNDATKTGNLFCGWYTEQNGGGTKINDVSQLAALGDNPSLYAWFLDEKENHTVSQVELSGVAKVGEILTATPKYGSDAFEGVVSYQWYYCDTNSSIENDWRAIEGASNGTYTIPASLNGKYIKVKATQRYTISGSTAPYSAQINNNAVSSAPKGDIARASLSLANLNITYPVALTSGDSPSVAGISVSGTLTGGTNNAIIARSTGTSDGGYTLSLPDTALTSSGNVTVTISAAGYEDITKEVFVTVKAPVPEVSLRTDKDNIPYNEIAFTAPIPSNTQYSVDGGTTWIELTADSFIPPANGKILVKTLGSGTPGETGYIADSDIKEITVSNSNKGEKIVGIKATDGVTVSGTSKVGETLSVNVTGEDDSNLTDSPYITYQWYIADSADGEGSPISGATGKTYTVTPENAGKYIYIKATQTNPATQAQTIKDSPHSGQVANGATNHTGLTVTYPSTQEGALVTGSTIDTSNFVLAGTLTGGSNEVSIPKSTNNGADGGYWISSITPTSLTSSGNVTVTISTNGYENITKEVFVTVKGSTPTAPSLSTDAANISRGNIKFTAADNTLEYSIDGGVTWQNVTDGEFLKPESLYVRKKAAGNPGQTGYVAPSEKVEVTISNSNVGTKVSAKTVTITVESWGADISVEKTESGGTVTLTAAAGYTDYAWDVDNGASLPAGFTADTNVLTITTTSIASGTYRVTVSGTNGGIIYSTGISVVVQ